MGLFFWRPKQKRQGELIAPARAPREAEAPVRSCCKAKTSRPLSKFTTKHIYDLGRKELKSRTECKLSSDAKIGINHSDKAGTVGFDLEHGAFKLGYDYQRRDFAVQYKKKTDAGTFTFRQIVPNLTWELVPTPIIELSTKVVENDRWKDSLRLVYDFQHRAAHYTETLKFNKKYKLRVSGSNTPGSNAYCLGYKVQQPWAKSLKLLVTPQLGPIFSHKVSPAKGWKVHTEASVKARMLSSVVTYKALGGDAEFVLDAAVPFSRNKLNGWRFMRKAGCKVEIKL